MKFRHSAEAAELRALQAENVRLRSALRSLLSDYRTEGCADPNCRQCARSKKALEEAQAALGES